MENKKPRVAVIGYGEVSKFALQAIASSPDLELAGVVRRKESLEAELPAELKEVAVTSDLEELKPVEAALLAVPTRVVPGLAQGLLEKGINTVDSYDLHSEIKGHRRRLNSAGKKGGAAAVVAAGWDPGTNSLVRALMETMAPQGLTFTNFGPGLSLGHSTAVRSMPGVQDALAFTIPQGAGLHRRLVYVELEEGAALETVRRQVQADSYFRNDETHVYQVSSVDSLRDLGHGALLERRGTSGRTGNQVFRWEMRINNPALTSQIMVAAVRAGFKQAPGAYTLLEIPLIDYLHGDCEELIQRLV